MNSMLLSIPILIAIIAYIIYRAKKENYAALSLAFLISLSWTLYYGYNYKGTNLYLLGNINVFALLGWTAGLMVLYEVFQMFEKRFKSKWKALALSYLTYLILIFPVEWFGYNILKIQLTTSYYGLFNLPLMHGTTILKIYYLTAGAIYLLILILLKKIK